MYFSRAAATVRMLVRGPSLERSMSRYLIDQIEATPNIVVEANTQLRELKGNGHLDAAPARRPIRPGDPSRLLRLRLHRRRPQDRVAPRGRRPRPQGLCPRRPRSKSKRKDLGSSSATPTCSRPPSPASSSPATSVSAPSSAAPRPSAKAPSPSSSSTNIWPHSSEDHDPHSPTRPTPKPPSAPRPSPSCATSPSSPRSTTRPSTASTAPPSSTSNPATLLLKQGEITHEFWILLLEGSVTISYTVPDGPEQVAYVMEPGASFGEVPLLANIPAPANVRATTPAHILRLSEEQFWHLMTECPEVRKAILGTWPCASPKSRPRPSSKRRWPPSAPSPPASCTSSTTPAPPLAAPPPSSAKTSSACTSSPPAWPAPSSRPSRKSACSSSRNTPSPPHPSSLNSLDQTDAEEALAEWMEAAQIEDAWKLAPTLVSVGIDAAALKCARDQLRRPPLLRRPQLARGHGLLHAARRHHRGEHRPRHRARRRRQKLRLRRPRRPEAGPRHQPQHHRHARRPRPQAPRKADHPRKNLAPDLPLLHSDCTGLNQIWTNLLDNAIDAVPAVRHHPHQHLVRAGSGKDTAICILVKDDGPGIPLDIQPRIFDPFYTTKPVGVGTGLGLGIVYRIVEQFGGTIRFTSAPGDTEFVVRLPNPA